MSTAAWPRGECEIAGFMRGVHGRSSFARAALVLRRSAPTEFLIATQASGAECFSGEVIDRGEFEDLCAAEEATSVLPLPPVQAGAATEVWIFRPAACSEVVRLASELGVPGEVLGGPPDAAARMILTGYGGPYVYAVDDRREGWRRDTWAAEVDAAVLRAIDARDFPAALRLALLAFVVSPTLASWRVGALAACEALCEDTTAAFGTLLVARRSRGPEFEAKAREVAEGLLGKRGVLWE